MPTDYRETLDDALDLWGPGLQMDVAIEELSELITELARIQRGTRSHADNDAVVDEIADCEIMLDQLAVMFGDEAVVERKQEKVERLRDRIDAVYEYGGAGRE